MSSSYSAIDKGTINDSDLSDSSNPSQQPLALGIRITVWVLFTLHLLFLVYGLIQQRADLQDTLGPLFLIYPLSLLLINLFHSLYVWGWPRATAFALLTLVLSLLLEMVAVASTDFVGNLTYDARPSSHTAGGSAPSADQPLLAGVPLDVPLSWYMMLYPCFFLADVVANGRPLSTRSPRANNPPTTLSATSSLLYGASGAAGVTDDGDIESQGARRFSARMVGQVLCVTLVSCLFMGSWDLVQNPISVGAGLWSFTTQGDALFFGVPPIQFAGFMTIAGVVSLCYLVTEKVLPLSPMAPLRNGRGDILFLIIPIFEYLSIFLVFALIPEPVALRTVAFFAMGTPLLLVAVRLFSAPWFRLCVGGVSSRNPFAGRR